MTKTERVAICLGAILIGVWGIRELVSDWPSGQSHMEVSIRLILIYSSFALAVCGCGLLADTLFPGWEKKDEGDF